MDLLKNFPKEWYMELSEFDNHSRLLASEFRRKINFNRSYSETSVSDNHVITNLVKDGSFFEGCDHFFIKRIQKHPNAIKITKEKFLELISEKPKTMIDKNKTINIGYDLLKEYYEGSTEKQKEHINKHFTIDGTTTIGAIIELHDMLVCKGWKEKIRLKHPECFGDDKYFDLGSFYQRFLNDRELSNELSNIGLAKSLAQIRSDGEYKNRGIILDYTVKPRANWEIIDDGVHIIAVPTKIKK